MAVLDSLRVVLMGDDQTKKAFGSVKKSVGSTDSALAGLRRSLIGVLSVGAVGAFSKGVIDATDRIGKFSDRIGVGVGALSEFHHAAELSGIETRTLDMALQRMTRRTAEAAAGTGAAKDALAELGLSATAMAAASPEEQFQAISDALNDVDSQADKVRLAFKLFDSEGVSVLQMTEGLRAAREEARALGITLSEDDVQAAAAANDAMTRLQARLNGVGRELVLNVAQPFSEFLNYLGQAVSPITNLVGSAFSLMFAALHKAVSVILQAFRNLFASVRYGLEFLGRDTTGISNTIAGLDGAIAGAAQRAGDEFETATMRAMEFRREVREIVGAAGGATGSAAAGATGGGGAGGGAGTLLGTDSEEEVDRLTQAFEGIFASWDEGVEGMKEKFISNIQSMAAEVLQGQLMGALKSLFPGAGGAAPGGAPAAGGGVGAFFGSLLGFETGGSFRVPGNTGRDTVVPLFRASPGERISIQKPGQGGEGGMVFAPVYNIASGVSAADVNQALDRNNRALMASLYDARSRGRA